MGRVLDVPYRSQWDEDANKTTTDCGPACLAMVLGYYGKQVSINELFSATGVQPGRYVGFGQMQRVAHDHGVTFDYGANYKLNDLKRWIDDGRPVIALVRYSHWSQIEPGLSTQDSFTGPHFVVVVGYGEGNIYINDPNYWPPRREEGHQKAWSEVLFNLAWSNVRTSSLANPNNSVIVPTLRREDVESIGEAVPPGETVVLGEGAVQVVDSDIVNALKESWIAEGRLPRVVDKVTLLRTFLFEVVSWNPEGVAVIEYVVQPGDTWTSIAERFLGDPTRYKEILEFNRLLPDAALPSGRILHIPPQQDPQT
jgi:uncharacterized protein YvpB